MDIRHLRHFLALAETLHFGRAAELLHITQPPLSISIRNLEDELGAPLFARHTRKIELTELGKALLGPARRAVQALEEVAHVSQAVAMGETGTLTLSFPNGAAHRLLPRVLPRFCDRYPRVEVRLQEATSAESISLLDSRAVDIGIVYHPLSSVRPYVRIPSEDDELVAVLPPGHVLTKKRTLKLEDLKDHAFIAFTQTRTPTLQAVVALACQRAGFSPRVMHHAQRVETIISLVRSGVGVSLVPRVCAATYAHVIALRPISNHQENLKIGLAVMVQPDAANSIVSNFLHLLDLETPA
ncbi:LysR family transcriptional regulator [Achromobacter denitrificans]|uniref:LysR family transcriptional regulator n=1 Tax=Achromobacter denitrificans TaxID=32002 RepID=UPI0014653E2F|nr:LysR substrate-binding domain-containing protein [Achromobacter denitrificans]CAB3909012.1 HTH-type transcriptional regulator GltC [Achromobacter denitrificans]